ncbi:MAG: hypothetical protein NTW03_17890, partial [Verrucomicrobia bacterium]|nr:hypothetical protein [Verrucomicrobiota bacterium]
MNVWPAEAGTTNLQRTTALVGNRNRCLKSSSVAVANLNRLPPIMKRFGTITVIGQDKTGVIARVTSFL